MPLVLHVVALQTVKLVPEISMLLEQHANLLVLLGLILTLLNVWLARHSTNIVFRVQMKRAARVVRMEN